ncbi:MAG: UDP-N-acetylmuramoyl-L-alanyl-D-glutamate--2,6-diaminopimelate ligase [Alphaproteobacteria bacterium]|nr:UDP-N-acetylmuramoyl-L-alanyl-D-glutamate--2,6-diaminopimelate ligase [Alphaproteobacteria bacterium]
MRLCDITDSDEKVEIKGITADSREVKQGFLFGSLNDDAYIDDAIAKGAAAVIVGEESKFHQAAGVVVVRTKSPQTVYAQAVAKYYGAVPQHLAAITGTNGKTSIADFTRQMLVGLHKSAASIGTLGIIENNAAPVVLPNTTPNNVTLHRALSKLYSDGVEYAILEASSHGLVQGRLDGVEFEAAGFTNLTRDHLDYHKTFDNYFKAKLLLFERRLKSGGTAVLNADIEHYAALCEVCRQRGCQIVSYGYGGRELKLLKSRNYGNGQVLEVEYFGRKQEIVVGLAGEFQAMNVLCAIGLTAALSGEAEAVLAQAEKIKGAKGRLEWVGNTHRGAAVYIDYAHTPDALENVLKALRGHTKNRLMVVFGCGGNRDKGKRPLMGKIANDLADAVYVTDDNPRFEDAAEIRREIMAACPKGVNIAGRGEAIREAMATAEAGDVLVLAGKGHESGQYINGEVIEFSDHDEARKYTGD